MAYETTTVAYVVTTGEDPAALPAASVPDAALVTAMLLDPALLLTTAGRTPAEPEPEVEPPATAARLVVAAQGQ